MNNQELFNKNVAIENRDEYPDFLVLVKKRFDYMVHSGEKLFTTNATGLYETFIENIPSENRHVYICNACRHFINRFGGLVTISSKGTIESVLWNENEVPSFFAKAVKAMKEMVLNSTVNGVFCSDSIQLGQPKTGEWNHLSVNLPSRLVNSSRIHTAGQVKAELQQDFQLLNAALMTYSLDTVKQAVALLSTETLQRGGRVQGIAEWFKEVIEEQNTIKDLTKKHNFLWLKVATAPTGFSRVKNSMIGTLLDDINAGLSTQSVSSRFADKMSTYMRSQVAPTAGNIQQAEKLVDDLGLANALKRRYASLEEIPSFLWKNHFSDRKGSNQKTGVFGNITPKERTVNPSKMTLPSTVMTWEKFKRTVLPTAKNMEVMVDNTSRLMALVTAADETAENILQWNNPFSWYYHGGIDGEIKRRVEEAGGRYENNEIRVSLIWESYTDLDIHVYTPLGEHIYFGDKLDSRGGNLDIDMNAGGGNTLRPVENIRWADNAPEGRYQFYVHNFADRNGNNNPYKVELEVNGKIFTYNGMASGTGYQQDVFIFDYVKGQEPNIVSSSHTSDDSWTVETNRFVKVNAITTSPNLWGENPVPHSGNHTFFLLEGVKDQSEGKGRGFFNETLKSDLREIRKTLEAYTASTPIEGASEADACGVGYSKDSEWNLTVKVTAEDSTRIIKIDRWD